MRKTLKKSLALVLSLLMLLSIGQLSFAAGDPETCEHEYSVVGWDWTEDYSKCYAQLYCEKCESTPAVAAQLIKETSKLEPTCENEGKIVLTAILTTPAIDTTNKEIIIPALGHDFTAPDLTNTEAVAAQVNLAGEGVHNWKCTREGCTAVGIMQLKEGTEDVYEPVTNGTIPCTSTGNNVKSCTSQAVCDVCGAKYGDKLAHNMAATAAKDPTCTTPGNIAYWYCSLCETYYSDVTGDTPLTITEESDPRVIPALGGDHKPAEKYSYFSEDGSAFNCDVGGYRVKLCTECGAEVGEREPVAGVGCVQADDWRYIGKNGEAFDCTVGGERVKYCEKCGKELGQRQELAKKDHDYVEYPEVAATCTEGGLTSYTACSVCGKQTSQPQPTSPAGHTKQFVEAQESTCSATGNVAYWICPVCGLIALDEDFTQVVEDEYKVDDDGEFVLDKDGNKIVVKTALEKVTIAKKPHTFEILSDAVEPECTQNGRKAIYKCSVCGQMAVLAEEIEEGKYEEGAYSIGEGENTKYYKDITTASEAVIKMLGHDYLPDYENEYVPATCTAEGSCKAFCKRCHLPTTLTLPKIKHTPDTNFEGEHFDPTCERGAYETRKCAVCGTIYEVDLYDPDLPDDAQADVCPIGHDYSGLVTVIQEADCTHAGIKGRACLHGCGKYVDGEEIPMAGHQLVDVRVEPDGHTPGYYGKQCTVCGQFTEKAEISVPADCVDSNGDAKCDVCGKILCDHMCHTDNAFMKIVWFVVRLWYQFLGINETCKCGLPHYTKASSIVVPD